ncbi:hypothetical protein HYC85_016230 [Camellia sinensis]|uniref:Uncharacterized protein n=1 Tax=Camellia sinensis TaxID=4442 RepID=A0A7J7GZ08_CAMSI|nr:hypothetical protein HYC85_016230 [Camellia sinensis]
MSKTNPRVSEIQIQPGDPLERPTLRSSVRTNKASRSSDHFYAQAEIYNPQNLKPSAKLLGTPKVRWSANYSARAEGKTSNCSISFATIALYIGPKWLLTSILAHLPLLSVLYARQKIFLSFTDMMELLLNDIILIRILEIVLSFQKLTNIGYSATILNQEEDVEIIVHHILGVIDSFRRNDQKFPTTPETKQEHFKTLVSKAATPFLIGRTDRFVNEVELFLASGLNIEAYDKVYMQHLGWKVSGITTEDEEGEVSGNAPSVPYLFLFDEDSDGIE